MTTIAPETPMDKLADRGEMLTDVNEPYMRLEIDTEEHHAIICFVEPLAFHAELAQADEQRFADINARARAMGEYRPLWSELTENGWLKAEPAEKLRVELAELIKDQTGVEARVWTDEYPTWYGDEPSFGFEIVTSYADGETFGSWFDRAGWPIVATIINVTDPGTFNCPYLFSAILYR